MSIRCLTLTATAFPSLVRWSSTSATAKKLTDIAIASVDLTFPPTLTWFFPGQVLFLAQESLLRHRQQSPQSYTSARSFLEPHRAPGKRISCHHHQPNQHPASMPKESCVIQCCRARFYVETLCILKRHTTVPPDCIARSTMTEPASVSPSQVASLFSE